MRPAKECSLEGCPRIHYAHGYCNPHWRRWKRNGAPGSASVLEPLGQRGQCAFAECDRRHSAKGLCASHYAQQYHGKALAPLELRTPALTRDAGGRKPCSVCRQWKDPAEFGKSRHIVDGLKHLCDRCDRSRVYVRRYGITLDAYDELLTAQSGACVICRGVNPSGRALAIDHDRQCCREDRSCGKCVRGLLCSRCNIGVGQFLDDPVRMRAAAAYVELRSFRTPRGV